MGVLAVCSSVGLGNVRHPLLVHPRGRDVLAAGAPLPERELHRQGELPGLQQVLVGQPAARGRWR